LLLDERDQVSYPDAIECDDGYIYITYDRERGCFKHSLEEAYSDAREILIAKIQESDILNGRLISEGGYLKRIACKLDKLAPGLPNPYEESGSDIESFAERVINECDKPLEKVFEKYPLNCVNVKYLNSVKLDELIESFYTGNCKDKDTLVKIIDLIRTTPTFDFAAPHPIIEKAIEYLGNLDDDITVSDIAKRMNVSIYYLSHLFKSVTGISVIEYRNELKLTNAKRLLVESRLSINQIATQCGFSNASYFSEVFSKSEKISPSQYRKYHSRRYC